MAMVMESTKACKKCGVVKPLSEFHLEKRNADGRTGKCKCCWSADCKKYAKENKERISSIHKTYYQQNKEQIIQRSREHFKKNRTSANAKRISSYYTNHEKEKEKRRQYYSEHKQKVKENVKNWRINNPDKHKENNQRRRIRKHQNGEYRVLTSELKSLYASACACCGSAEQITVDHIIPIARGGRHSIGNLQPLCKACNSSKQDKLMIEWKQQKRKDAMK